MLCSIVILGVHVVVVDIVVELSDEELKVVVWLAAMVNYSKLHFPVGSSRNPTGQLVLHQIGESGVYWLICWLKLLVKLHVLGVTNLRI